MISNAEIPDFPTFYLIESFKFGFLTLLKIINVLMVFIFFNFYEICFDEF